MSPSHNFTPVLNRLPVSVLTCTSPAGNAHQSFIIFPVAQSSTARCPSVLLAGPITSPVHVHGVPCGIQKFNTAALDVPTLVTVAELHGDSVVVVPTVILAAAQSAPSAPSAQGAQVSHCTPCGIVKFNTAAVDVPVLVIATLVPAAPVVTVPTVIVPAGPVGPVGPCGHWIPCIPCIHWIHWSHFSHFRLEY